jgi:predicted CXXCH cytochrome family protein
MVLFVLLVLGSGRLAAQAITSDVLGSHDLGALGGGSIGCQYCHAPHSGVGGRTPLWNQKLSTANYTPYSSTTFQNQDTQPVVGAVSSLCLSCHDGTVATGQTVAYGKVATRPMPVADVLGTDLQSSHPFSLVLPMKDSPDLVASLIASKKTGDVTGMVRLIKGNVECSSCHTPHMQFRDRLSPNFLVLDNAGGHICLSCHDPNRVVTGQTNPLAGWGTSIHATSANTTSAAAKIDNYGTVAQNACLSCHKPHSALGVSNLLRGAPSPALPNFDASAQSCSLCHAGGTTLSPLAPNVAAEYAKIGTGSGSAIGTAHTFPAGANLHDAAEKPIPNNPVNNRHATCVDCHSPHASLPVASFPAPPAIRPSQTGVVGISGTDGVTPVIPAVNQFENCFRCHGTSSGKQAPISFGYLPARIAPSGDPLNVVAQFVSSSLSRHPVTLDRNSPYDQPSLLSNMLQLDGASQARSVGARILCTDCHNSDDNREFGGPGANGPHGSQFVHLLERRYEIAQAPSPGMAITNTFVNPSLTAGGPNPGPYALCAKCHDLTTSAGKGILSDASFKPSGVRGGHYTHIWDQGISCSVCHTAHGTGATASGGQRLVSFDVNVVAPNNSVPVSYNRTTNTCTLTCHSYAHNSDGTVVLVP